MAANQPLPNVNLDKLNAVRKRYADEANKRIRPDAFGQFLQLTETDEAKLSSMVEDPWADHEALNAQKSPIEDKGVYRFFIVGAGFGALQFAVRLIEQGVASPRDIRLADAGSGFGGTWHWNRFPGLHCDLESYIYLPLLEKTGYIPTHKYVPGEEIRLHAIRIAHRWELADKTLFRSDVRSAEWNDKTQLWTIRLNEGRGPGAAPIVHEFQAQYVYLAAGVLTRPQVPKIPGILSFAGSAFHTARWNYAVSGGSPTNQVLTGLKGKKVAVVGTAATAIGVIPEVAKYAGELYVFQRTPAYVKPRKQRKTDEAEFRSQVANTSGWQFDRQLNFNSYQTNSAKPGQRNLVNDGWTEIPAFSAIIGSPNHGVVDSSPEKLEEKDTRFHILDLPHMEGIRARVDEIVKDPDTAAKLKPWYPSWCKRPTFSDTYLHVFNQPNVHLVDTDGKGVTAATERGLVVDEKEYPVDIIIFGTGFKAPGQGLGSPTVRTGIEVTGRHGKSLNKKWQENGAATLHGYATNGFPNFFFSAASQGTQTGNNIFMLDIIARHVIYIISQAERRVGQDRRAIIEVTTEAERAHTAEIVKRAPFYSSLRGCTPGYFNLYGEGTSDPAEAVKRARGATWSEGTASFLEYIGKWEEDGSLDGLSVVPVADGDLRARI